MEALDNILSVIVLPGDNGAFNPVQLHLKDDSLVELLAEMWYSCVIKAMNGAFRGRVLDDKLREDLALHVFNEIREVLDLLYALESRDFWVTYFLYDWVEWGFPVDKRCLRAIIKSSMDEWENFQLDWVYDDRLGSNFTAACA